MIVHIEDLGASKSATRHRVAICGKSARELWPARIYHPDRNIKTLINQVRSSGKTCELCIFCSKWGDLVYLADTEL